MINNQPVTTLIRQRYSCRSYQQTPISHDKKALLHEVLSSLKVGPLGTTSRFLLIAADEGDRQALKGLTTYGFIKNPSGFILGATSGGKHSLEDFGYLMEYAVLYTTGLDLGSVWIGGTFNKGRFAQKMQLGKAEHLPAVIAIGLPAAKPRAIDAVIRRQARASIRKPWGQLFFSGAFDTPLERSTSGAYAGVLDMVQRAPSASNKQPWRIVKDGENWHFYLQRTRGYKPRNTKLARVADMQRIDMGIAMCHFELTSEELNLPGYWEIQKPVISLPDTLTEYTITWVSKT